MKIEIGEYIRTKYGIIGKYEGATDYDNEGQKLYGLKVIKKFIPLLVREENIAKHSKNIIDLIEVGDYVNGKYVYKNGVDFSGYKCLHMESSEVYACEDFLYEEDIKSIVTQQQFKNMEYRL